MKYLLMHKNIPVALLDIDDATCVIRKISDVYNEAHLPVGVHIKNNIVNRAELNDWWLERSIPASRSGVRNALELLDISDTKMLLTKCLGLSLSDQYWICPSNNKEICWENVNFFTNAFSEDIGDILIGKNPKDNVLNLHSPDNTSDGYLKKRWKIIDGKRYLIKGGTAPFMQQTFNEVIASKIMDKLDIFHIPYHLVWENDIPYSACEDFVTSDTEFVSAWKVMQITKKNNNTSMYQHYINCCESLNIPDIKHYTDQMIVIDYIIANEDRHLNNFGLIRNAETLKWIGVAPVFDSGSSLGYDKLAPQIISKRKITCKPFKNSHEEQIKLVSSFDWIDFDALKDVDEIVKEVFSDAGIYNDKERLNAIIYLINQRISEIKGLSERKAFVIDDIKNDVTKNIAEDYKKPKTNKVELD